MLAAITLLFTTLNARIALSLGWAAKLQVMPLAMTGALTSLAGWLVITLIFGRVYCSSVCPMGTLQDIVSRIPRMRRQWKRRHPYHFSEANNKLRYFVLLAVAVCAVGGLAVVPTVLDPYSAFGRICSTLLLPVVELIGGKEAVLSSGIAFAIAGVTLVAVAAAAWRNGRIVCNTVCPVGSALSIPARWSLYHFDIDTDRCINCRACEHVCKAKCISMADHVVDSSRCVVCFDCVDTCHEGAIRYTTRRKRLSIPMMQRVAGEVGTAANASAPNPTLPAVKEKAAGQPVKIDRRRFLATGLLVAAAPALSAIADTAARFEAEESGARKLRPTHPVAPPGRRSMADFLERCTGCGLCVAQCPTRVLRPSSTQFGWLHPLRPVMDYDRGMCEFNCTRCTDLCPTGALTPLTIDEKHIFIIGHARVETANCIGCGLCAENCPKQAIRMKRRPAPDAGYTGSRSEYVALVDTSNCIGCGACQEVCPATPYKAIIVDGII